MAKKRDYAREYRTYHSKPSQIKRRAKRNGARKKMMKLGRVHKGDGLDIDHIGGIGKGNKLSNLRVMSKHKNRSIKDSYKKRRKKK
jgi:hypothetical protein